jgi:uncharacterized damage-inducible protein DinB
MKPTDPLTHLFDHHLWANLRLLESCQQLTGEQLQANLTGTFGSIQETLEHIVRAEKSYLSRISTGQPYRHPPDAAPMTIADMLESARQTGLDLIEWAPKVQAGDAVEIDWDGTLRDVPKTVLLTQAINHATEHRAQIMVIMTQLGVEPPDLDSWTYFDQLDQ